MLMAAGLVLRIYTSCDFFLHPWDEVYHALVAKHMMHHPFRPTLYETPLLPYDPANWTGSYIWLHKPPLPLWSMALSMSIFGVNEIALRLPSIILTTIGIGLTYYIGAYFYNKRSGYIAAFFYSINGLIIEMTAGRVPTDHVDVFFLFFIELGVFFSIVFSRNKNILFNICAGLSIGAAILSKWLPALIVLPIWLLIVVDSKKFSAKEIAFHFISLLFITILTFLPWQLYIYHAFPVEAHIASVSNYNHITEVLDNQGGSIFYYIDRIRINYGELIYIPLLWFGWTIIKEPLNMKRIALLLWILIPILFFSLIGTKMQGFILFTCPALFIVLGAFFDRLNTYKASSSKRLQKWTVNFILILLIVLPFRYMIERVKPFQKDRSPEWVNELKNMNEKNIAKGVIFNYDRPIDAMFYTQLTVYSIIPDKNTIQHLQEEGYTILINENDKVPTDILSIKGLIHLHLSNPTN